jgi:hypothetical protein
MSGLDHSIPTLRLFGAVFVFRLKGDNSLESR